MSASGTLFVPDLSQFSPVPEDGILSRTVHESDAVRVIYFGFAAGELLSEHTAAMPAIIEIIEGTATLTLGTESHEAGPGSWAYMPANLPHSLEANTPVVMLLTLLKKG